MYRWVHTRIDKHRYGSGTMGAFAACTDARLRAIGAVLGRRRRRRGDEMRVACGGVVVPGGALGRGGAVWVRWTEIR
jgi:hypothetical protein